MEFKISMVKYLGRRRILKRVDSFAKEEKRIFFYGSQDEGRVDIKRLLIRPESRKVLKTIIRTQGHRGRFRYIYHWSNVGQLY